MYPEQVGNYFPLPVELIRPIRFQLAYVLIKQNLRFPKTIPRHSENTVYYLPIESSPIRSVDMKWYWGFNVMNFVVRHTDIVDGAINCDRSYMYNRAQDEGPGYVTIRMDTIHGF